MIERVPVLHRQTKQETAFIQALHAAENFKPTPFKRPEVKKLSAEAIDSIVTTAEGLGDKYAHKLLSLSDTQEKIFSEKYVKSIVDESDHELSHHSHHAEHHHDHSSSTDGKPVISRTWQLATVAGNAVIGAAELITGGGTTLSVTTDGIHNAGDAATYYMQTENVLNPKLTQEKIARRRKIAHSIIAGLSLAAAVKAGYDIHLDDETTHNPASLIAASASLTLNAALIATLYRGINRKKREGAIGPNEKDLTKHLWAIDVPSAAIAVGGAVVQRYGVDDIESVGALVSGLVGAYAFRPTKDNLDHSNCAKHADHTHSHGHGHHIEVDKTIQSGRHSSGEELDKSDTGYIGKRRKETASVLADVLPLQNIISRRRSRRQVIAAAVLTGALSAGAAGAASTSHELSPESTSESGYTLQIPVSDVPQDFIVQIPPESHTVTVSKPTRVFERVQQGDSQWGMVEDAVEAAGHDVSPLLVNTLTDLTAYENQQVAPNPDRIQIGQELAVPSADVITLVDTAIDNPTAYPELTQDIQELHSAIETPKEEKIKHKESVLQKIKNFLKSKLTFTKRLPLAS